MEPIPRPPPWLPNHRSGTRQSGCRGENRVAISAVGSDPDPTLGHAEALPRACCPALHVLNSGAGVSSKEMEMTFLSDFPRRGRCDRHTPSGNAPAT